MKVDIYKPQRNNLISYAILWFWFPTSVFFLGIFPLANSI